MTTEPISTPTTFLSPAVANKHSVLRELFASTPLAVFVLAMRAAQR